MKSERKQSGRGGRAKKNKMDPRQKGGKGRRGGGKRKKIAKV